MALRELLVLAAVLLVMTVVRLTRSGDSVGRGYTVLVAGILGVVVVAFGRESDALAVAAVALTVLVVVLPWGLEALARLAFARGYLGWAVRFAGLRAILMLGSGLARQQEILHGLALLEREGVDAALAHFRGLADATEDGGELALINEQIVSMLFYGQRWDEGIAFYEARFPQRYAALRPALAVGLLRAYGESGRMQSAAGLLRALEEGPVGADPQSIGIVSQARLTFLAYAGLVPPVSSALVAEHRRDLLGLTAASGALFEGIAWSRAGHAERARDRLREVESLASAREERIVDASRRVIAELGVAPPVGRVPLEPDLGRYAELVAHRLESFLQAAPKIRRSVGLVATWSFMAILIATYVAFVLVDAGGLGLLRIGALTAEAESVGQSWRVFCGVWAQADPVAVMLNLYALWLSGPVFERVYGAGRMVLCGLGGAVLGLLGAQWAGPLWGESDAIYGGAHLLAVAVVVGAIWTLLPIRSPAFPQRARRALLIPLLFVLVAQILCIVPGVVALTVPAVGVLVAFAVGLGNAWIPATPRLRGAGWAALPLVLAVAGATLAALVVDPRTVYEAGAPRRIELGGRVVTVERPFAAVDARAEVFGLAMPLLPGAVDALAIRTGDQVQLVGAVRMDAAPRGEGTTDAPEGSLLFAVDPTLRREMVESVGEVPAAFAVAFRRAGGDPDALRWVTYRRNGKVVAAVLERRTPPESANADPWVVGLLVSPPEALEVAPGVYARALASQ